MLYDEKQQNLHVSFELFHFFSLIVSNSTYENALNNWAGHVEDWQDSDSISNVQESNGAILTAYENVFGA